MCVSVGMSVLSIESVSCVLYCAGSGVKRVAVDLSGFNFRLFSFVQSWISSRYGFRSCSACLYVLFCGLYG